MDQDKDARNLIPTKKSDRLQISNDCPGCRTAAKTSHLTEKLAFALILHDAKLIVRYHHDRTNVRSDIHTPDAITRGYRSKLKLDTVPGNGVRKKDGTRRLRKISNQK